MPKKGLPGDLLHNAIVRWFGEEPAKTCGCEDWMTMMNAWGVQECLVRLDEITDKLWDEAQKRKWWRIAATIPFSYSALRLGVKTTILRAGDEEIDPMSDCLSANPDMTPADMVRLIEHCPPGPWPSSWATWPNVIEAHKAMARHFADTLTPNRTVYPQSRGIVIGGGGPKYLPGVWVCVKLLRHFGCQLPIQLWYLGDEECDPYTRRLLAPLGVECIDARKVEREHPCRVLCGWELKLYATLHCPFAEVLYLDADNGPIRDPTFLFDADQYKKLGAIFWADYDRWRLRSDVWDIFGMPEMASRAGGERAFESGQFLIDKSRCGRELQMALWYGEHSDFTFSHVYGDKECFHLGWRKLGSDYAMPDRGPAWIVHTILQYDFDGKPLFNHRCQDKWTLTGNRQVPQLANEDLCFDFIRELKTKWTGAAWFNPFPTEPEKSVVNALIGKRFVYRRVGYGDRPMALEAAGRIGVGAAGCEKRWDVNEHDGSVMLTISGDVPTCHLRLNEDGVWRGAWLNHERMPIELVPA